MVVETELHGFTIELAVELKPNQEPKLEQERSLEDLDLTKEDYRLSNLDAYPQTTTPTSMDDQHNSEHKEDYTKVDSIPSL